MKTIVTKYCRHRINNVVYNIIRQLELSPIGPYQSPCPLYLQHNYKFEKYTVSIMRLSAFCAQ